MKELTYIILVAMMILGGCAIRKQEKTPATETTQTSPDMPFDPLASARDREVVPEVAPMQVSMVNDSGDTSMTPVHTPYPLLDSTQATANPDEVYRVQIFTSRLYAEANRELALAEEIFNLPVYLDYEVPYYKLRVGDFTTRDEAENMLTEIRAIGYRSAWVARVNLKVLENPEFTDEDNPLLPAQIADSSDSIYDMPGWMHAPENADSLDTTSPEDDN